MFLKDIALNTCLQRQNLKLRKVLRFHIKSLKSKECYQVSIHIDLLKLTCINLDFEKLEKEVDEMCDEDMIRLQLPELASIESPEITTKRAEVEDEKLDPIANFCANLNTSIGTLLSSSFSSNNMQTVTLSSMDSYDFTPNQENIFGGNCDIDAIIKGCTDLSSYNI